MDVPRRRGWREAPGVDVFDVVLMSGNQILQALCPPPSLRDTSAGGGH